MKKTERRSLAAALNSLLAAPTFANWRQGTPLDVADWLSPKEGKTPVVVLSVAHLDDEERALVLGVVLEEVLSWIRTLPGSQRLRALVVFDEVYGFLPPHPSNPPTKRPLVSMMKQARAFGVGVVVATQNPMDLDYRALSNAGLWFLGRLQTDADRARVLDGLAAAHGADGSSEELGNTLNAAGQSAHARVQLHPVAGVQYIPDAELGSLTPNHRFEAFDAVLAQGPCNYRLVAEVANPDDPLNDASVTWPAERPKLTLGTLSIARKVADSDGVQRRLIFDPTHLVDGIELSSDPLPALRSAAYAVSYRQRDPSKG